MVHHSVVDALVRFLKDVGMINVKAEFKYWDPVRVGTDATRRVPDVICTNPHTQVEYVVDARIFWNAIGAGATGYVSYTHEGLSFRGSLGCHCRESGRLALLSHSLDVRQNTRLRLVCSW